MIMDCRILTDTYVMLAKCEITKVAKLRVAGCVLHTGRNTETGG